MKKSIANTAAVLAILGSVAFPWSDSRDPVTASHRAMRNVAAVPFDFSDIPSLKDERTEIALDEPYELDFTIEKTSDGQYALVATMELFGGSFYVSPRSTGDFKGKFRVEVAPNKDLEIGSDFTEEPRSKGCGGRTAASQGEGSGCSQTTSGLGHQRT